MVKWRGEVKSLSRVRLFATPWTVAHQAPPSMGFSRQEYWSGLPFPSPGYLPNPGIEPRSPTLHADALTSEPPGKPIVNIVYGFYWIGSFGGIWYRRNCSHDHSCRCDVGRPFPWGNVYGQPRLPHYFQKMWLLISLKVLKKCNKTNLVWT